MNSLLATAALGIALPALLFLAIALAIRRVGRERAGAGLALPFGLLFFFGAAVCAGGLPPFPPVAAVQGIGYAAVAAGVLGLAWSGLPSGLGWTGKGLFLLVLLAWTARSRLAQAGGGAAAAEAVGWALFLLFAWGRLERRAARVGAVAFALPLALVLGGGAALFFPTGSALLAQEGGLLAALVAAGGAAFAFRAPGAGTPSLAATAVPVFGLLLVNAQWYSGLPAAAAPWLALALVAPEAGLWLPEGTASRRRLVLGLGAALLCVGIAAAFSWKAIVDGLSGY